MLMKRTVFGILILMVTACTAARTDQPNEAAVPTNQPASYPDLGPAPELTNSAWLNVDAPLRLADLRSKVVAIDMWTFG
jgi:hypothetical protein